MIEFLQHTPAEQRQAFLLTAQKKHLPEPSIEKDWWSNYPDNYTEYYIEYYAVKVRKALRKGLPRE